MNIDFSREAEADIAGINREGIRLFGVQQAQHYAAGLTQAFRLIADYPQASPVREGMTRSVRTRPYGVHVILYEITGDTALILRICHGREDWTTII